jgi:hypothetical protein
MQGSIKAPPLVALQRMPQSALWHSVLDLLLTASSPDVAYQASVLLTDLIMRPPGHVLQLTAEQVDELWQMNVRLVPKSNEEENG